MALHFGSRGRSIAVAFSVTAAVAACSERLPESPAGAGGGNLTFMLNLASPAGVMDGSDQALAKTDAAHVTVQSGSSVVLDSTLTFSSPFGGSFPVSVQMPDATGTFQIGVELRAAGKLTFTANGGATLRRGERTEARLTRVPVIAGLAVPDSLPALTALGDSVRATAAAAFATGDTIPDVTPAWTADGSGVVRVAPGGFVVALSEGQATLTASLQAFTATTKVRVKAAVNRVAVAPDSIGLFVDSSRTVVATARDRNGNALQRTFTWQSSSPAVATVDASGLIRAMAPGQAQITAASEGQSGTVKVSVRLVPVANVSVGPTPDTLRVGETIQLAAVLTDASGRQLTGRTVAWSSSNPAVATVDATGRVQGVAPGTVTVTASSEGKSGTASVTVLVPVASVSVSPSSVHIAIGSTTTLTAATFDAQGQPLTGRAIAWTTSDGTIATVSPAGVVSGVAVGVATITATSEGKSATSTVTVEPPVASVTVTPATARLALADTLRLTATLLGPAGETLTGRTVTWTSGTTGVATVDQTGLVKAVEGGTAVITATSEGKSGTSTITVYVPIVSVTVSPQSVQLIAPVAGDTSTAGRSTQLEATAWDALGRPMSAVPVPVWSSSDPRVADVDQTGLVTAYTEGTATITASIGGVEGTSQITVAQPVLTLTPPDVYATGLPGVTFTQTVTVSNSGSGYISGLTATFLDVECNSGTGWVVPTLNRTRITTTTSATLTLTFHPDTTPNYYCGVVRVESTTPGVSPYDLWVYLDTYGAGAAGAAGAALPSRSPVVRSTAK